MSIFIGIDPGKKGGISFLNEGSTQKSVIFKMPETELGIPTAIRSVFTSSDLALIHGKAIIEKVHAFPGQGVTSMFTFGQGYGFLRGVLVALAIPFEEVTPQKWQKYFGLSKKKNETQPNYKKRILQVAQNMFPDSSVKLQTADSLMLAEYLRRINNE